MATVSNVTPLFHLGSHVHRFQGDTPPRPCSWRYTSTVYSVTPPHQTLYLSLLGLSLQGEPISQTLYLGSHVHGGQYNNPPQMLYLVSHGTVARVTPTSRPCTWGHTYTFSKVRPLQTLPLQSHIHSLQSDSSKILYLGSHIQSPG